MIIVASVSCIYGLGSPESYHEMVLSLHKGQEVPREDILHKLVQIRYERNDIAFERGRFRVRGDVIEVFPAGYNNRAVRIELFGDEIDRMVEFDVVTGEVYGERTHLMVFPASHYVTEDEDMKIAMQDIRDEDIDYSDIPPIGDNVIVTPIGHKFIEMARRNLARMNAEKANAL